MSRRRKPSRGATLVASGGAVLVVLAVVGGGLALWGFEDVEEGHENVMKYKGDSQRALTPGEWYWFVPWTHSFEPIDMRPQIYTMVKRTGEGEKGGNDAINVKTADQLVSSVDVAVTYEVTDSVAFHERWRDHQKARVILIRNPARSVVYDVGGNMTTEEITTDEGRAKMRRAIEEQLSERLSGEPIELMSVEVRDIRPPQRYMDERRKIKEEEQRVQQAELQAEQRMKEAEGEAEANRIVSESLDENLLNYRQIQALENGSAVYVPVNSETGLPTYLDVTDDQQAQRQQGGQNNTANNSGSLAPVAEVGR